MQRCVVFQNHLHQTSKVSRLLIFIIQDYTLYFTFCCTFSCREAKDRECIVFGATRYKLFYVGARDKILQLICDFTHIIPCFHFCAFVSFLNVDYRVCITVQRRLAQLTQVLIPLKPNLCSHVNSNSHVTILFCSQVLIGIFPEYPCHFIFSEYEVCDLSTRTC